MATKAYSYLRFSTPKQEWGDSQRRQQALAQEYAARNRLDLDEASYRDLGMSAKHGRNIAEGELGLFLEAVRGKVIEPGSYLLVESLDRISRDKARRAIRTLESIADEGITVVTLADGKAYTTASLDDDPMSFMYAFLVAMRAHEESAMKSRRVAAAWEAKRARIGKEPMTSWVPAWLHKDGDKIVRVPERVKLVQGIYRDTLKGVGLEAIAQRLNAEAVEPWGDGKRKAQHWHRSYVSKILDNPAVIGTFTPHKDVRSKTGKRTRKALDPIEGYYPPVIERDVWDRVQQMRSTRKLGPRGRHAAGNLNNIFSGLLKCPTCDGPMYLHNKGVRKGHPGAWIVCRAAKAKAGCVYKGVAYHKVEDAFLNHASELLAKIPAGKGAAKFERELEKAETAIDATEDGIENVLRAIERDPSPTLSQRLRELQVSLDELKQGAAALEQKVVAASPRMVGLKAKELSTALHAAKPPQGIRPSTGFDRREVNALLRQLAAGIVVDYDEGDLVFRWAHGTESRMTYDYQWPKLTKSERAGA
jgi:DNA invertase Pin-like site-specific DNA recombinase